MAVADQPIDWQLKCSVCPEQPLFSDISHLLTHLASKSHLSFKYKLDVYATENEQARVVIQEYDAWYQQGNVHRLMAARLSQKDKERLLDRLSESSITYSDAVITPDSTDSAIASPVIDPRLRDTEQDKGLSANVLASIEALYPKYDGPPLDDGIASANQPLDLPPWDTMHADTQYATADGYGHENVHDAANASLLDPSFDLLDPSPFSVSIGQAALDAEARTSLDCYIPTLPWNQGLDLSFQDTSYPLSSIEAEAPEQDLLPAESQLHAPSIEAQYDAGAGASLGLKAESPAPVDISSYDFKPVSSTQTPLFGMTNYTAEIATGATPNLAAKPRKFKPKAKRCEDMTTLKGDVYPGMGLFDSATVAMKRQRNQRKDPSVLARLMADADEVDASEFTWDISRGRKWKWLMDKEVGTLTPPTSPVLGPMNLPLQATGTGKVLGAVGIASSSTQAFQTLDDSKKRSFATFSSSLDSSPPLTDGIGSGLKLLNSAVSFGSSAPKRRRTEGTQGLALEAEQASPQPQYSNAFVHGSAFDQWHSQNMFDELHLSAGLDLADQSLAQDENDDAAMLRSLELLSHATHANSLHDDLSSACDSFTTGAFMV